MKEIQNEPKKFKVVGQVLLAIPAMLFMWLLILAWSSLLFTVPIYILYKFELLNFLPRNWGFLNCWLGVATVLIGIAAVYNGLLAILYLIGAVIGSFTKK